MGPLHRKKDGSNSNSSRTSPSRIEDAEFVNSLLASKSGEFYEEGLLVSLLFFIIITFILVFFCAVKLVISFFFFALNDASS